MAVETAAPRRVHARTHGNRLALAIWAGLATAIVLLVVDGLWAGRSLLRNLTIARSQLNVGIEAIVTGDPEGARPHFLEAAAAADRAVAAAGHPSMGIAGLLPLAGPNIEAATEVASASRATAAAGVAMIDVTRTLDWTDIGLPGATAAGSLDVEALALAAPQMDGVVTRLEGALRELEEAGAGRLIGPVGTGYGDALESLTLRADLAARLRDTLRLGPEMFGGDRTRRYLLSIPSLGVPRPAGGAATTVGILVADQGTIRIESLAGGLGGLAPAPPEIVEAPTSQDWPTTARALLKAARGAGAPRLDGVISLDSIAMEDLVWVSGDVGVKRRKLPLTDSTTSIALEIDAFQESAELVAAETHAAWSSEILRAFLASRPGLESFALATARDARARHLLIYTRRPSTQELVSALGLGGTVPEPQPGVVPVIASWSATAASHVGALVDTRIHQDVRLRSDGAATVLMEVSFENGAESGSRSALLGQGGEGIPVGTFAADVTVHVPDTARNLAAETSRPSPVSVEDDLGYRAVTGSVSIGGGESSTFTVRYSVKEAVVAEGDERRLVLRLLPQPTLEGIGFALRITVPDEARIVSASPELDARGSSAAFDELRGGPTDLEIRYVE